MLVAYAAAIGVFIDLDHFLLARLNAGDWGALRAILRNPRLAVFEQDDIFAEGEVTTLERLLSHVLIIGVAVPVTAVFDPVIGLSTAVVLYVHLLSDLAWDVRRHRGRQYGERVA